MIRGDRERLEVDALRTDRYLDALLVALDRRAADVPADVGLEPAVRQAATALARDLSRVHPSFRFEERLGARLAEEARSMRLASAAGGETLPVTMTLATIPAPAFDPVADATRQPGRVDPPDLRPFLIGGALTSAALSLAGAAWVAWRRSRPVAPPRAARTPMARAVRAAHRSRRRAAPARLS